VSHALAVNLVGRSVRLREVHRLQQVDVLRVSGQSPSQVRFYGGCSRWSSGLLVRRAHPLVLPGAALVIGLLIVEVGCAPTAPTAPTRFRISAEEAQAEFGPLAVATVEDTPRVSLGRRPLTRGKGAAEGALVGAVAPAAVGPVGGGPYGLIAGIMIAPLSTVVGTIYGALAGKNPEQVERAALVLEGAGQTVDVQYRLRDLVIAQLNREHLGGVMPIRQADTSKPTASTVVEVWITDITLGGEGINPALTLQLSGGMRLLRMGDEVAYLSIGSGGQRHTFLEWAADDARLFKEQIAHESERLAKDVVQTLLSRPLPEYPTLRPPGGITCPGTSVWNGYGCISSP
jgi:hypothetical protein